MPTDTASSSPEVVVDAGPLIHLDELECLDLLDDFPIVMVPEQVWQEVRRQRTKAEVLGLLHKLPEVSTLHVRNDLREEIIQAVQTDSYSAF